MVWFSNTLSSAQPWAPSRLFISEDAERGSRETRPGCRAPLLCARLSPVALGACTVADRSLPAESDLPNQGSIRRRHRFDASVEVKRPYQDILSTNGSAFFYPSYDTRLVRAPLGSRRVSRTDRPRTQRVPAVRSVVLHFRPFEARRCAAPHALVLSSSPSSSPSRRITSVSYGQTTYHSTDSTDG